MPAAHEPVPQVERTDGDPRTRQFGWSDLGNLWVKEELRRKGIGTWLLGTVADWLRLGGIQRLLTYTRPDDEDELGFATHHGFKELVRTERGWVRKPTGRPGCELTRSHFVEEFRHCHEPETIRA